MRNIATKLLPKNDFGVLSTPPSPPAPLPKGEGSTFWTTAKITATIAFVFAIAFLCGTAAAQQPATSPKIDFFPVTTQFTPVPSGEGWKGQAGAIDEKTIRDTIDNILAHGFTGIEVPTHRPEPENSAILKYAQSRGMIVTAHLGDLENFGRDAPPSPSVYAPEYPNVVREKVEKALAGVKNIARLYNAFSYQDEPFHGGKKSFDHSDAAKAAFKKRFGYDMPADAAAVRSDPKKWLDFVNFQSDEFRDGWRQTYKTIKGVNPNFKVIMTHDSHSTFGGAYGSNAELFVDDVFHWGGDFADTFVFDIYPYMMFDFRYGEFGKLPKPRISQAHYSFAQMRNLTQAYGKEMGFWVGTYNAAWFKEFLGPERLATYWSEREMSTTAVAQGADFLLTGYHIPSDAKHWESFGEGLRLIQKAGSKLLGMPKKKARAAMLFPRTQLIQTQEEYFNVALSYELFLRAFGELDILHEEQIKDDRLDGYQVLALFDVTLLPADVAERIAAFARNGGVVIADCVPNRDAQCRPMNAMAELFGVKDAKTDRVHRSGHFVPRVTVAPYWFGQQTDESKIATDSLKGEIFGQSLDLTIVSPRPATPTTGKVDLKTASQCPAVVVREVGRGKTFLLGFCLQDTYFKMWQDDKPAAREQLAALLLAMTRAGGARAHVRSSNPNIEAALRANDSEGFLFVINHEAASPDVNIALADVGFDISSIIDLADGKPVQFSNRDGLLKLSLSVPVGQTKILQLGK